LTNRSGESGINDATFNQPTCYNWTVATNLHWNTTPYFYFVVYEGTTNGNNRRGINSHDFTIVASQFSGLSLGAKIGIGISIPISVIAVFLVDGFYLSGSGMGAPHLSYHCIISQVATMVEPADKTEVSHRSPVEIQGTQGMNEQLTHELPSPEPRRELNASYS
jgi:hypothetical protein